MKAGAVSLVYNSSREIWVGRLFSLIEAYNMALFPFLAPYLSKRLFIQEEGLAAVLFSYCLVLVAFSLFYPLGSIVYGYLGDMKGRKMVCSSSGLGLAVMTGLMGIFPLGLFGNMAWAWFLMLICLQHFFSGGEYQGSIVYSLEHNNEKGTGLSSAMSCFFAVVGLLVANGVATLAMLSGSDMAVRGCFLLGGLGGFLSLILRNNCQETPVFSHMKQTSKQGLFSFLYSQRQQVVSVIFVFALFVVSYSYIFLFIPLVQGYGFATFQALAFYGLFLIVGGLIADRVGIAVLMEVGAFLFAFALLPLSYCCSSYLLQIFLTLIACSFISPIHSWMIEQFHPHERCRGVFIGSAIAIALFGGSTVPICLLLYQKFQSLTICALYPLIIALPAFFFLARPNKLTKLEI